MVRSGTRLSVHLLLLALAGASPALAGGRGVFSPIAPRPLGFAAKPVSSHAPGFVRPFAHGPRFVGPGLVGAFGASYWLGGGAAAPVLAEPAPPPPAPLPTMPGWVRIGPPAQGEPGYQAEPVLYRIVPGQRRQDHRLRVIRYRL